MKYKFTVSFLLGSILLGGVSDVQGQHWKQLSVPYDSAFISPYFINADTGFIFNPRAWFVDLNHSHPFRTTDGGSSWTALPYFDSAGVAVLQIYFESATKGYIAASDGVYETENTGMTWRKIYKDSVTFSSVYAFGGKVFAYANQAEDIFNSVGLGPLISTTNDGNTWDTIIAYKPSGGWSANLASAIKPYVFGNKDGLVFAENFDTLDYSFANVSLIFSTDNGNKWNSRSMDTGWNRTLGLFSFPHCNDLLRILQSPSSDPTLGDEYYINYSPDTAKTWNSVYLAEIGSWIAGNNCVQYINDAFGNQARLSDRTGLWRSLNHGKNWEYVAGPNNTEIDDWDYPDISVVGGGAVVYVTSTSPENVSWYSTLWKTTDGGDGTLSENMFASSISFNYNPTLRSSCDTSTLNIIYQNLSCNYSSFKNFAISGLDSNEFSSEWFHHLACNNIRDTILIKIFPFKSGPGIYTLHSHFENDEFERIDTSFNFTIFPSASFTTISSYLKTNSLSANSGDTLKLPIYINSKQSPIQPGAADLILTFSLNTNLLTPLAFIPMSGVTADPVQITKSSTNVTLHFDPNFTFSGETELGRLRCVAYVTDTLETDITLTGAAHSSGCLATFADSNTVHFTLTGCGTQTLSNFMKFGTVYNILSITPNPAGNSVQVELKNNGSLLHYELLDALGAVQKSGTTMDNQLQINLSGLSSGNYYFRLSGEGGIPVTRSLIISK